MNSQDLKKEVHAFLLKSSQSLSFIESCTGGGVSQDFVKLEGSSKILKGCLVPYQDEVKAEKLGIDATLIQEKTAVCFPVAEQMSKKGREYFNSDWALATTGWTGPEGGSDADPVGTIYFAVCDKNSVWVERRTFKESNNREALMTEAIQFAWTFLHSIILNQHKRP